MFEALILAAGYGSRLKPWTDVKPKPLLPFFGVPMIDLSLMKLLDANASRIHVNGFHLSQRVENHLKNNWNKDFIVFHRESQLLGTGGPIAHAHKFAGTAPLLVHNSDCISNVSIDKLMSFHDSDQYVATMALLPYCPEGKNPVYKRGDTVIHIGKNEKLEAEPGVTSHMFMGIHIVGSQFRSQIPSEGFQDIRETYYRCFETGAKVGAYIHDDFWFDLGTPLEYWQAHEYFLTKGDGMKCLHQLKMDWLWQKYNAAWKINFQFGKQQPRFFEWGPEPGSPREDCDMIVNTSGQKIEAPNVSNMIIHSPNVMQAMTSYSIVDDEIKILF